MTTRTDGRTIRELFHEARERAGWTPEEQTEVLLAFLAQTGEPWLFSEWLESSERNGVSAGGTT